MARKPKAGKVKVKIEDVEITEDGTAIVTAEITHPQDRKGELLVLRGIPFDEVDEVSHARALCFAWLNAQGFNPTEVAQYITDTEENNADVYWHFTFWDELVQDINREHLEEDWDVYWENQP